MTANTWHVLLICVRRQDALVDDQLARISGTVGHPTPNLPCEPTATLDHLWCRRAPSPNYKVFFSPSPVGIIASSTAFDKIQFTPGGL
jgi:hypothetical protein